MASVKVLVIQDPETGPRIQILVDDTTEEIARLITAAVFESAGAGGPGRVAIAQQGEVELHKNPAATHAHEVAYHHHG